MYVSRPSPAMVRLSNPWPFSLPWSIDAALPTCLRRSGNRPRTLSRTALGRSPYCRDLVHSRWRCGIRRDGVGRGIGPSLDGVGGLLGDSHPLGQQSLRRLSLHGTETAVWPIGDGHVVHPINSDGGDLSLP